MRKILVVKVALAAKNAASVMVRKNVIAVVNRNKSGKKSPAEFIQSRRFVRERGNLFNRVSFFKKTILCRHYFNAPIFLSNKNSSCRGAALSVCLPFTPRNFPWIQIFLKLLQFFQTSSYLFHLVLLVS